VVGALIGMGMPELEAKRYEEKIRRVITESCGSGAAMKKAAYPSS
jgi:hypothetical protein